MVSLFSMSSTADSFAFVFFPTFNLLSQAWGVLVPSLALRRGAVEASGVFLRFLLTAEVVGISSGPGPKLALPLDRDSAVESSGSS